MPYIWVKTLQVKDWQYSLLAAVQLLSSLTFKIRWM